MFRNGSKNFRNGEKKSRSRAGFPATEELSKTRAVTGPPRLGFTEIALQRTDFEVTPEVGFDALRRRDGT
jgi:hypothetical protein